MIDHLTNIKKHSRDIYCKGHIMNPSQFECLCSSMVKRVWNRVLPKSLNLTENEYHNHIIPSTWGGQSAWSREDSISAFPRIKLRDIFPKS